MIHHREKSVVRRFDIFKLIVLLILIALLLWFWLSPPAFVQGPDEGAGETAVADTTTDTNNATTEDEGESEAATAVEPAESTAVPTIEAPTLDTPAPADGGLAVPTLNLPEDGLLAGPVSLSGTGTPGSEVGIVVDDEVVGTATVGDDGTWTFDAELAAGTRGISVQALDAAGSVANESESVALALTEITPPAFAEASYALAPGTVDFAGTGTPGTTVELVANGAVVGTAVVADDGTWTMPAALEAGAYDLSLRMLSTEGELLGEADGVTATVAAAETEAAEEAEETAAAEFVPPTFTLPEGALTGGEISLGGTGTPGSEVAVVVDGAVVGTAVVADDGSWNFPITLPAGDFELALQAVDGAGTAVTTDPVTLTLAEAADTVAEESSDVAETAVAPLPADFCKDAVPGIDQGDTYIVGVCEWLVKIANRLGIAYPDLIGVNPQIENPNLIYPGQVINLPPR